MRILISGLHGFTGHYVKSALEKVGHDVVGLSSNITDYNALSSEVAQVKPEAVIHLAAVAFVGHGTANAFYEVNLIGTRNLLEALAINAPNVQSVLLASSANVYGNRSEGALSECATPYPANDYAVSKLAMENMAQLWMEKLPVFIVRPFNYTGIGQDIEFLIPKIVSHFLEKKPLIELGNLDVWREFNDVRFVAESYQQLLELNPRREIINICTGKTHSLREVIGLCQDITGHNIEISVNPDFVRANEVRVLKGDNTKLKSLVGDIPTFSLEKTLRWMLECESA
ncbi:MAG: GDP-mannose 4,6-dehydratase [Pseudomonadales bacterium]|nr:GDP-mannose 4,6-dehydratase [Pseudomonadales bacterium]